MSQFKGKNTIKSSFSLYYHRSNFIVNAYPEGQSGPKMARNLNIGETELYGIVDTNFVPMVPKVGLLSAISQNISRNNGYICLPFVANMLYDLKQVLAKANILNCSTNNQWINDMEVYRAYESPVRGYKEYMGKIMDEYVEEIDQNKGLQAIITDFESFVKFFIDYVENNYEKRALTFTGWLMSRNSSIYNTGMGIALSDLTYDDDDEKWEQVIGTEEFSYFKNMLLQLGFSFDFNMPTTIFPDLSSPAITPYLQQLNISNVQNIFDTYYDKSYIYDINILNNLFITKYNSFVNSFQYGIKFNETCPLKTRWSYFERTTIQQITDEKLLDIYLQLRNLEQKIFNDQQLQSLKDFSINIQKMFDNSSAIEYINEVYQAEFKNKPYTLKDLSRRFREKRQSKEEMEFGQQIIGGGY